MMPTPPFLLSHPRWIAWREETTTAGRVTKVPYDVLTGTKASATDPRTWTDHDAATKSMTARPTLFSGLGIVLGDLGNGETLAGLDLDTCLDEEGDIAGWAKPYLRALPTYAEVSPSGTGLKLFFRMPAADLAEARRVLQLNDRENGRKRTYGQAQNGAHPPAAELYLSSRYFTVTGQQWHESPEEVALLSFREACALADLLGDRRAEAGTAAPGGGSAAAPESEALAKKLAQALRKPKVAARYAGSAEGLADTSRSARDMSLGAMLKAAGFTAAEMRSVLQRWPHGAAGERAEDDRYYERIWNRSDAKAPDRPTEDTASQEDAPRGEATPIPLTWFADAQPKLDTADFVEGLLVEGGMAVTYGESNSGKTFWASDLGLHVAAGRTWNGREVLQGGVVYLALEGGFGIANRVAAFRQHYGLDDAALPFAFATIHIDLLDPEADRYRVVDTIKACQRLIGMPVRLTIVDTLSRALSGGNENAPDDMGALVNNTDYIREHAKCCVNYVHHSGKDAAKGARGHSILRAATDTEIEITNDAGFRAARVTKQRDLECTGAWSFRLEPIELGKNQRGKPVTSCVVVAGVDTAGAVPSRQRLSGDKQRALEVLADLVARAGRSGDAGVPSGFLSVPDVWWRDAFYEKAKPGAEAEAKKKAFQRAADGLVDAGYVGMSSSRVWIIARQQPHAESEEDQ